MKKILIVTLALGLFLISCQKSDMLPNPKSGTTVATLVPQITPADLTCTTYSIFNPHGPTGATVQYSYLDCSGQMQTGWLDPRETITVVAQHGLVKCPGGVVTEM
jgi:hypothetical protein